MKFNIIMVPAAALALAACGGGGENRQAADQNMSDNMAMNDSAMMGNGQMDAAAPTAANGQEYATMAAASDMFEIESSRLAQEKGQNAQLKEFAQMLITDHERSTRELQAAAQQAQPPIQVAPQMNGEQQQMIQALRSANGAQFDQTYIQQQVAAHQKALALVQGYAQNGEVPSLKQHATTVSGPIQQHLERAQQLQQQVGQGRGGQ